MKKTILACTVAVVALAAHQAISADSVRSGPPADVPWQAPNARALNGKAENQLNVNSANTANTANSASSASYAANAGALGGGDLNWVRNNAVYAHSAGAASTATTATTANTANTAITATNADNATNATNATVAQTAQALSGSASVSASQISGLPTCGSGQVLSSSGGVFTCVTASTSSAPPGACLVPDMTSDAQYAADQEASGWPVSARAAGQDAVKSTYLANQTTFVSWAGVHYNVNGTPYSSWVVGNYICDNGTIKPAPARCQAYRWGWTNNVQGATTYPKSGYEASGSTSCW